MRRTGEVLPDLRRRLGYALTQTVEGRRVEGQAWLSWGFCECPRDVYGTMTGGQRKLSCV